MIYFGGLQQFFKTRPNPPTYRLGEARVRFRRDQRHCICTNPATESTRSSLRPERAVYLHNARPVSEFARVVAKLS
jgi:hypothetical protein